MAVVFAILLFSLIIFVHELGHFVAAKLCGVRVNEFAMFMGPALVKWKRGETQYSIRCIPIGGYCAMEGEDEDTDDPRSFLKASWWKRLIILVAGSFMNLVIGMLLVGIVLSCQPKYASTQLETVESWSMLSGENGLRAGDEILEVNGKKIRIYEDFLLTTMLLPDGQYDVTVRRDGEELTLQNVPMIRQTVTDEDGSESKLYGISFGLKDTTAASVAKQILPVTGYNIRIVIVSLKMLLTGQASVTDLGGPVQIVKIMSDTASQASSFGYALLNLVNIGALIAINLAVMNMLPIPALDGGRCAGLLVTTAIEKISKKKINPKYEGYIHGAFMVLLLGFMAFIMLKDIFTIVKG